MKKTYYSPELEELNVMTQSIIALSLLGDADETEPTLVKEDDVNFMNILDIPTF